MTRSRWVVLSSLIVVSVGAVAAVGAFFLDPARAAVGPLAAEGLALPADTRFVMGLDVKRFAASPFYAKYAARHQAGRLEAFKELEEKTGLNPERDLEQLIVAGRKDGTQSDALVLVSGRFDQYKLGRAIETQKRGVTSKKHEGTTVYLFREGHKGAGALAFLDDDTLVLGNQQAVEETLTRHRQGSQSIRSNTALVELLGRVKPGSTFWMVGDQGLLANMPKGLPGPGGDSGNSSVQLPALKSLVVTGDLDPLLAIEATGDAADEAAARNLADVVRGLVALASLQASQKPELKELASAVSVTTEGTQVHVNARFPYELLDSLQSKKPAEPSKKSAEGTAPAAK